MIPEIFKQKIKRFILSNYETDITFEYFPNNQIQEIAIYTRYDDRTLNITRVINNSKIELRWKNHDFSYEEKWYSTTSQDMLDLLSYVMECFKYKYDNWDVLYNKETEK